MQEMKLHLIDTHSHLYDEAFDDDREAAIMRATEAGIDLMILPAIDRNSYEAQANLEASHPTLFRQMMGLHPTSVSANFETDLAYVHTLLMENPDRYVAIGEIGLDFYWDRTFAAQQMEVLQSQLVWAQQLNKPVALHIRKAYTEMFQMLARINQSTCQGVMHCFGGTIKQAQQAIEMGFYIGIGGVVTFKNASMADVVREIPLERILLETDAPYLTPVPHRGKRNESAYIVDIAQKIADIKECSLETVAVTTTNNARTLFQL